MIVMIVCFLNFLIRSPSRTADDTEPATPDGELNFGAAELKANQKANRKTATRSNDQQLM